jgi:hypothetical protein
MSRGVTMTNNSHLKCPSCGSYDLKQAYQLHIGSYEKGNYRWTTRKYREANNLEVDIPMAGSQATGF